MFNSQQWHNKGQIVAQFLLQTLSIFRIDLGETVQQS